ncbi:DEAD/DEAH box helicase [Candidatus Riflebacteria bacterium]
MLPKLKARTERYIHFVVEGNAFMEGYLFLTPEPLKLFPYDRENVTLQVLDEENNSYTAILHKNYRYIACLGFKHWYQKNRVQDGDEVIFEIIDLEKKIFRISLIKVASLLNQEQEENLVLKKKPKILLKSSESSVLEYSQQSMGILKKILNDQLDTHENFKLTGEFTQVKVLKSFETPYGLNAMVGVIPIKHQQKLVYKVIKEMSGRAILADEAGLGKNVEALQILMEYYTRDLAKKILILTPAALAFKWQEELKTKAGLDSVNHFEIEDWTRHDIVVSSMDTAKSTKNREELQKIEFDIVIIDEAHRLKNPSTKNWKFVNTLSSKFMLFLTASPIHTDLMDLYNLVTIIKPGLLKTSAYFKDNFIASSTKKTLLKNKEDFKALTDQVIVRTMRSETEIPFPRGQARNEAVDMSPTEKDIYKSIRNFVWENIESVPEVVKGSMLNREVFLSLLEVAGISLHTLKTQIEEILKGHVREDLKAGLIIIKKKLLNLKEDTKLERLIKILSNMKEKAALFFLDPPTLDRVSRDLLLRRFHIFVSQNELPEKEKDRIFQTFSRIKNGYLLVDKAAGNGRSYGDTKVLINYDIPWSPIEMEQRIGRVFNIANQQKLEIINLFWTGSVEDILVNNAYKPTRLFEIIPGELETLMMCIKGRKSLEQILLDSIAFAKTEDDFHKKFGELDKYLEKIYKDFQGVTELQNKIFS